MGAWKGVVCVGDIRQEEAHNSFVPTPPRGQLFFDLELKAQPAR